MQIEGTKLTFIMNFGVLDFFKFAPKMPQIAQILASTYKIFQGIMPPDPLEISSFFLQQCQALSKGIMGVNSNKISVFTEQAFSGIIVWVTYVIWSRFVLEIYLK